MSAIQMDPNIQYPDSWLLLEYVCECGKKIRVDFEPINPYTPQAYQHNCGKDEKEHCFNGPIIAACEDGMWVIVAKRRAGKVSN
jgi:hypothetical protein